MLFCPTKFQPGSGGSHDPKPLVSYGRLGARARSCATSIHTGTRSSAICRAALMPTIGRGHVDLDRGVFYRRAIGRRQTKKRQPPVRLSPRLLAHLRRWKRLGVARDAVVEWNSNAVKSVSKGFEAAARAAGL